MCFSRPLGAFVLFNAAYTEPNDTPNVKAALAQCKWMKQSVFVECVCQHYGPLFFSTNHQTRIQSIM